MAIPHKCPVCLGSGLVSRPPHVAGDVATWTDSSAGPHQCKGCNGVGIIWEKLRNNLLSVLESPSPPAEGK